MNDTAMMCPMCLEEMRYDMITNKKSKTHAWICRSCPLVMFEYYSDADMNNLKNALKKRYEL